MKNKIILKNIIVFLKKRVINKLDKAYKRHYQNNNNLIERRKIIMGTLLSILGSIGIISSGAGTTLATSATNFLNTKMISSMPVDIELSNEIWDISIWEIIFHEGENIPFEIFSNVAFSEISWDLIPSTSELSTLSAVDSGIFAGTLGTAAETLGISLAIGAAIYGGYYTYQHWDSVKHFASEAAKTAEQYVSSATDYLKSLWPF